MGAARLDSVITPPWILQCAKLHDMLVDARRAGLDLRFRLPPKEILAFVPLAALIDRMACNDDSLTVGRMLAAAAADDGAAGDATVFMLHVALESACVPFRHVSLQELGLVS